jgi:hypothetical protein
MLEKVKIQQSNQKMWKKYLNECKRRFDVYNSEQSLDRTWMHVDMDMFFAACEIRD